MPSIVYALFPRLAPFIVDRYVRPRFCSPALDDVISYEQMSTLKQGDLVGILAIDGINLIAETIE